MPHAISTPTPSFGFAREGTIVPENPPEPLARKLTSSGPLGPSWLMSSVAGTLKVRLPSASSTLQLNSPSHTPVRVSGRAGECREREGDAQEHESERCACTLLGVDETYGQAPMPGSAVVVRHLQAALAVADLLRLVHHVDTGRFLIEPRPVLASTFQWIVSISLKPAPSGHRSSRTR